MNSRRICPVDGSRLSSAVGLAKAKINQLEQELRSLLEKVQRRKQPAGALARTVISSDDVSIYSGESNEQQG
ncbi:hypothetical protein F511_46789 [Dorcoceras hygrometricum]|uniref:Uncharacterized protein n=1 Tax=Dorcoceras hygrometricum TaxID=472368 RepID=A0A2Z6ZZE0_9LAMI|nr:hypothetical protein F511_46789 [Dorcoceras hygrometricum]